MTVVETRERLDGLVREHLNLVYASALRQMKDPHAAADVTQAVFLVLQRRLPEIDERVVLAAWLMRVTRYACLDAAKRARRRSLHENKAAAMRSEHAPVGDDEQVIEEASPLLDEALDRLSKADRELVLLAYYQELPHEEIAAHLGIRRDAAHKRVQRAVGRLRRILTKDGLPAAGIAGGLTALGHPKAAPLAVSHAVMNTLGGQVPALVQTIAKGTIIMLKVMKGATGVLTLAAVGVVLVAVALVPAWGQTRPAAGGGSNVGGATPAPVAADNGEFMPEVTLTIFETRTGHDFVADLDSGKIFSPPRTPPREAYRGPLGELVWAADEGWDVVHENASASSTVPELIGFDMTFYSVPNTVYDQSQTRGPRPWLSVFRATPATPAHMSAENLPAAYAFRTREGGIGLLQLVKSDRAASSLTFRYRLLSKTARNAAIAQFEGMVLDEMDRLAELMGSMADPLDVKATVNGLTLEAASVTTMMKGTNTRPTVWRGLENITRSMAEKVEDKQPQKVQESVDDLKQALRTARDEMKSLQH